MLVAFLGLVMPASFAHAALVPDDPYFDEQWYLEQIGMTDAWEVEIGSEDVIVAVLDTGIDLNHPDIAANLYTNPGEVEDGYDNDGNGYVDDVHGWDFYSYDNDTNPTNGAAYPVGVHHGTITAGIIGAVGNNSEGVAGVAWNVKIMPLRVLDSAGDGSMNDIVNAIDYAVDMGADVINMSFVGTSNSNMLDDAIERAYRAGVVIVASSGNDGADIDSSPLYPICSTFNTGENMVIGVAATNMDDMRADFSNYGSLCVDIAAPGESVFTTQVDDYADAYGGGWQGTSLSGPVVSGVAALMKSQYPNATPDEILLSMQLSVDPVYGGSPSGVPGAMGAGRLNAARALEILPKLVSDTSRDVEAEEEEVGDIVMDGSDELSGLASSYIAIGAGAGDAPLVELISDIDYRSWYAYAEGFKGGIDIAAGDVDGDGEIEYVTAPGAGGGPHVRVFDALGHVESEFFAYEAYQTQGLQVATGDVDADGEDEIFITRADWSAVHVFDSSGSLEAEIEVESARGVLNIAAGDVDGDGADEIVVSRGYGSVPYVSVYEVDGKRVGHFMVYAESMDRGVYVSTVSYGSRDVIVTGTGDGAGPHVRVFDRIGALVTQFFAFNEVSRNGVRVAGWNMPGEGPVVSSVSEVGGVSELRVHNLSGNSVSQPLQLSSFENNVTIGASN